MNEQQRGQTQWRAQFDEAISERIVKRLREEIETRPDDGKLWFKLAQWQRKMSCLQEAAVSYEKAAQRGWDTELCRFLRTLMEGGVHHAALPQSAAAFRPAPFLMEKGYLDQTELAAVWGTVRENVSRMKHSRVFNGIRPETRDSRVLSLDGFPEIKNMFLARVNRSVARAEKRFGLGPTSNPKFGLQITSHADGEFYRTHRDGKEGGPRRLSFVFYLHDEPRSFSGGHLRLFDTETAVGRYNTNYTLIEPTNNTLVIFPSIYFHEVCVVSMQSSDRLRSRITLNGWVSSDD